MNNLGFTVAIALLLFSDAFAQVEYKIIASIKSSEESWGLALVTSAVESDAGKDDGQSIFIACYKSKRNKQ